MYTKDQLFIDAFIPVESLTLCDIYKWNLGISMHQPIDALTDRHLKFKSKIPIVKWHM